jgi:alpha,alpha-trehalase
MYKPSLPFSISARTRKTLHKTDVSEARQYIQNYWKKLERHQPRDDDSLISLPKPYLVPASDESHNFDFNEMYYWDSYFMLQGILDKQHRQLAFGIVENMASLFERFRIIPNASRTYLTGRSQPPFFTSMIWDVYDTYKPSKKWLGAMLAIAQQEYREVWMGTSKPHARQVYRGLSRYYDINMLHDLAEAESGWDMTPRFGRKCLDFVPVDLNSLLYKYETDFARYYRMLGDARSAAEWETAARHRKITMDELMFDKGKHQYYDFNYVREKRSNISSLAGFYPLWAGMVDQDTAKKMVRSLRKFIQKGGLATTDTQPLNQLVVNQGVPTQWAYPNGWAPLHFLVVSGLLRYGFRDEAKDIAMRWLKTNIDWFAEHGVFLEKYNVVNPEKPPVKGVYPSQVGFGWTNAVFEYFCREFIDE